MDKRMASSAYIYTALTHISFIEVLFKPLVAMAGFWDQVMEGNQSFASAKRALLAHFHLAINKAYLILCQTHRKIKITN
jgi:hypothetical protein